MFMRCKVVITLPFLSLERRSAVASPRLSARIPALRRAYNLFMIELCEQAVPKLRAIFQCFVPIYRYPPEIAQDGFPANGTREQGAVPVELLPRVRQRGRLEYQKVHYQQGEQRGQQEDGAQQNRQEYVVLILDPQELAETQQRPAQAMLSPTLVSAPRLHRPHQ